MSALDNDSWTGSFPAEKLGSWRFTLQAWVDHFATWCFDLKKRLAAQPDPTARRRDAPPAPGHPPSAPHRRQPRRTGRQPRLSAQIVRHLKEVVAPLLWMADQNADYYEYPITAEIVESSAVTRTSTMPPRANAIPYLGRPPPRPFLRLV